MNERVQSEIQKKAMELLDSDAVQVVIGWASGNTPSRTAPAFIQTPEQATQLVWNKFCLNNLATYLVRKEVRKLGKVAVIVKSCDMRAVVVLIQENQIKRENVHIIGVVCDGTEQAICNACNERVPQGVDTLIGETPAAASAAVPPVAAPVETDAAARWEFWKKEFAKCIKCYACRSACPLCYCTRCIVEKSQPQWISPAASGQGNLSWNVIRAMHLAGRCTQCGACERACPMGIPLSRINNKLALFIKEQFGNESGTDSMAPLFMSSFSEKDKEDFFH